MVYHDIHDNIEHGLFKNVIANHCLLHEIEMHFKCTSVCYKEKLEALNIGNNCENDYYVLAIYKKTLRNTMVIDYINNGDANVLKIEDELNTVCSNKVEFIECTFYTPEMFTLLMNCV